MKKTIIFVCALWLTHLVGAQSPLINYPSLSPDGNKIAFNYQGDIWVSSANGSQVHRVTVHEAYDTKPRWTADGKNIVFQSNRYGNNDIYVMPSTGGTPKRLTYHSANDILTDVTDGGEVFFQSKRGYSQIEREHEIQSVSIKGGTPSRRMDAMGFDAVVSPDNKLIAFVRGTCRIEREAYQGSANRDIWIFNVENNTYHQITDFQGNDYAPHWKGNNELYYVSAESGRYNIQKVAIDSTGKRSGSAQQVTNFENMGVFSYAISRNGSKLVLTQGDQTFLMNTSDHQLKSLTLNIGTDDLFDRVERKTYSGEVREVAASPNDKLVAMVIRGEIFVKENDKDNSRSVNVSNSPYRDRMITWLSNEKLIFVSDREGQQDLYLVRSSDSNEKSLFKSLKRQIIKLTNTKASETDPVVSPDGKKIAFIRDRGKLIVADISGTGVLANEKVLLDGWDEPSGLAWSPDSQWLSYSKSDLFFNEEVYIQKVNASSDPVNISMHPKGDRSPVWSKDGSKIGFSSNRNNSDYDVWFTWLRVEDWQKTKEDWDNEKKDSDKSKSDAKDKKSNGEADKTEKPLKIDLEDIHLRQVQVTNYSGGEFIQGFSKDGKTIFYSTGNGTRYNFKTDADLFKIKWNRKDKKALTKGNAAPRSVFVGKGAKNIYYTSKGKLKKVGTKDAKVVSLPLKASMNIDYDAESDQIFEEAWIAIRDGFYDPNHHGRDWNALKEQYKPLAMKASTRSDFKSMFNRMLGQINASHMGMYRGEERADLQKETTGLLGVQVQPVSSGSVQVTDVIYGMPGHREASKLNTGDLILSVNGHSIGKEDNFFSYLSNTSNEQLYLSVKNEAGATREVIIRPKSSSRKENYLDWVKEKKRLTKEYSNGRLGYIHIQGMNWTSFEEFERELTAEGMGKDGVVIDVRFNGGGWTTDYLMAVLTVRQHAYTIPRGASADLKAEHQKFNQYYPYSERLPLAALNKPSIALCNSTSYSNAEIFSHAYKNLGLGTLVGQPTFGAVISTGGNGLIDGSYVRMPFRGWFVKATGDNMDFVPAVPDIILANDPDGKAKGQDKQLKRAVDELLKQL